MSSNRVRKKCLIAVAHEFINNIETTKMTLTYKMHLLLAFYNAVDIKLRLSNKVIYESFREFYNKRSNALDLLRNKSTNNYKSFGEKEYLNIAKNPKDAFINSALLRHFKDVIDYRTRKFYKERLEKEYENLQ